MLKRMVYGALGLMMGGIMLVGVGAEANATIVCKEGSLRAGKEVENAADCNVADIENDADKLPARIQGIINVLLAIGGILAVVAIIYGGAQMMLSQGDSGKVQTGKNAVIYGVIGLVVSGLAWAITSFVIASVAGGM